MSDVALLSWAEVRRVIHDYLAPLRWVGNLAAPRPSWPNEPCGYLSGAPDTSWLPTPRQPVEYVRRWAVVGGALHVFEFDAKTGDFFVDTEARPHMPNDIAIGAPRDR